MKKFTAALLEAVMSGEITINEAQGLIAITNAHGKNLYYLELDGWN
ncbi:MAG: hypothetical protein ABSD50_08915 [Smithella sp.]